jgi:hypothetical protein
MLSQFDTIWRGEIRNDTAADDVSQVEVALIQLSRRPA